MTTKADTHHQAHVATALIVALVAALVFGVIVVAAGDWIPGSIIVVAAIVGIARQVPAMHNE